MKKIIYLSATLSYAALGIFGSVANAYLETGAFKKLMAACGLWMLLTAAITGFLAAYFFPKVFLKGYGMQRKAGKILVLVILIALSFALTVGVFKFINSHVGKQTLIELEGRITNKWVEKGNKGARSYFLKLRDNATGESFEFKVKRKVYEQLGYMGSSVKKDFYRGSLGIVYRHSY